LDSHIPIKGASLRGGRPELEKGKSKRTKKRGSREALTKGLNRGGRPKKVKRDFKRRGRVRKSFQSDGPEDVRFRREGERTKKKRASEKRRKKEKPYVKN